MITTGYEWFKHVPTILMNIHRHWLNIDLVSVQGPHRAGCCTEDWRSRTQSCWSWLLAPGLWLMAGLGDANRHFLAGGWEETKDLRVSLYPSNSEDRPYLEWPVTIWKNMWLRVDSCQQWFKSKEVKSGKVQWIAAVFDRLTSHIPTWYTRPKFLLMLCCRGVAWITNVTFGQILDFCSMEMPVLSYPRGGEPCA